MDFTVNIKITAPDISEALKELALAYAGRTNATATDAAKNLAQATMGALERVTAPSEPVSAPAPVSPTNPAPAVPAAPTAPVAPATPDPAPQPSTAAPARNGKRLLRLPPTFPEKRASLIRTTSRQALPIFSGTTAKCHMKIFSSCSICR